MALRTYGSGAMRVISPARSAVAPTVPRALYICPAKRGNTAANVERIALFAAIALAAIGRYAVTRYVKTEVKMRTMPVPKGTDPRRMGRIQGTEDVLVGVMAEREMAEGSLGKVVSARRSIPRVARIPPGMPMRRRVSGGGFPL